MPKIIIVTLRVNGRGGGTSSRGRSRIVQTRSGSLSKSAQRRLKRLSRGKCTAGSCLQLRSPTGMDLVRRSIHGNSNQTSFENDAEGKNENVAVISEPSSKHPMEEVHKNSKEEFSENNSVEQVTLNDDGDVLERGVKSVCPICLDEYVQPIQLPCSHIFCFLCAKGLQRGNGKCALCRKTIPEKLIKKPKLLVTESISTTSDHTYGWFYEGKEGWWQYDDRTAAEIEDAFMKKENMCEVMIAGSLYVIDFLNSRQTRKDQPFRSRKIKRDLISVFKKGIAGVKL